MGGGSTTTVTPAAPTAQELELQNVQVQLAREQLDAVRRQSEQQAQAFEQLGPLIEQQTAEAQAAAERAAQLAPLQQEIAALQLESLRRGGGASPEQLAAIEAATGEALSQGESDIAAFEEDTLRRLREELAPGLGLRPTDTPILDRGALIGRESTRQQGQLASGLREAQQTAILNFPLAQQQVQNATAGFQQQLAQRAEEFNRTLQQQAFQNRLALSGQTGQLGLGLANISVPFPGFQRGSTTTVDTSLGLGDFAALAGGAGGFLTGVGTFFKTG